jgi:predicted metal-binding membrane protein
VIVLGGLIGLCLLAWLYLFYLVWMMDRMPAGMVMAEPQMLSWSGTEVLLCFIMWAVMMVGMMIPSAAPMIMIFSQTYRKRVSQGEPYVPTSLFVLGYLAVWTAFSLVATAAQWGLHATALLSPTMLKSTSPVLGGVILIAAGVFQWTDLKQRCLKHCRSPLNFLLNEWRDKRMGALIMGLRHGLFCLGCCWALMGLLFVTGVMNLFWVALVGIFVLVEKLVPLQRWVSGGAGALLVGWGFWLLMLRG